VCCKNKPEFIGSPKLEFQEPLALLVNLGQPDLVSAGVTGMLNTGRLKLVVNQWPKSKFPYYFR